MKPKPVEPWGGAKGASFGRPPGGGSPDAAVGADPSGRGPASPGQGAPRDAFDALGPPLSRLPFSPSSERVLSHVVLAMRVTAGAMVGSALVAMVGSVAFGATWTGILAALGQLAVAVVVALPSQVLPAGLLVRVSNALARVGTTDEEDQARLIEGLRTLRWLFLVRTLLFVFAVASPCVLGILGAMFYGMLASVMGPVLGGLSGS